MQGQGGVKFNNGEGNKVVEYVIGGVHAWGIVTHCLKVHQGAKDKYDSLVCVRRMQVVENPVLDVVTRRIGVVRLMDLGMYIFITPNEVIATRSYRMLDAWSLGFEAPTMRVNIKGTIMAEVPEPIIV